MTPAFKTAVGIIAAVSWIAFGREQVRLGASGWDVTGCFLLALLFSIMAVHNARKL